MFKRKHIVDFDSLSNAIHLNCMQMNTQPYGKLYLSDIYLFIFFESD